MVSNSRFPRRHFFRQRAKRGLALWSVVGSIAALAVVVAGGFWVFRAAGGGGAALEYITHRATVGPFAHDVVERGELESSANTSVRCEVQARNTGSNGVKIIEIVPEGTVVKQGDFLVRFDDAALQAERTTQEINVASAEAAASQSANDLEAAVFAKKEYEFGEFEQESEKLRGEILVAQENTSRAQETVEFSEKLARRGYMSRSRLRSDKFDLAKAGSELKVASTKFRVLNEYTRLKKIKELEAKLKTCEAKLKADEAKLALERQKFDVLVKQIGKCLVNAPVAGQVIYDHEGDNFRGAEYQIKQGTVVNEQRVVIRLPDPKRMQVVAKVAESRIDRIKSGMPAAIEIEGLPGVELKGKVTKVNEYPAPENWFNSNVKEYATTVEVFDPPEGLRPGMTAKVAIRVETIPDALQVPIQAVFERGGKHYCLLARDGKLEPREVLLGSTNEKFQVVRDGISRDDDVLLNPRVHSAGISLPGQVLAQDGDGKLPREPVKSAANAARRDDTASGGPGS